MSDSNSESPVKYFEPPVFLSESKIKQRVRELAEKLNQEFGQSPLTLICTLKGGIVFYTDLIRHLKMPVNCEFLGLSSYGHHTQSTGEVKVTLDLNEPLIGKHVVVVEDIVDSGLTLSYLLNHLRVRKPASLKTVALLFKPEALKAQDLKLDLVGFEIPNKFVVGYGLDYAEKFRGLPYIGHLDS